MGITGQILTSSTICIPEGSRYVPRKESYSEDGIDSINPTDGKSDSYKAKEQPFENDHRKEPSILDLSLGTPRAVSFASIKSSSSNFSEWQTC